MSWKYSGRKNSIAPNEKSITKIVVVAPRKLRRLKKSKLTSGCSVRRSTTAKIAKAATPPISSAMIAGESQPQSLPWMQARVIAVSPVAVRKAPGRSIWRGAVGSRDSGVARSASRAITAATATLTTKIQRQLSSPVSTPPAGIPIPETSSVAAPQIADRQTATLTGEHVGEQRHRRRHQQGAADPGDRDPGDQQLRVARGRGQHRAAGEQDAAGDQCQAPAEDVGDPATGDQHRRERDVEGGHRPLQRGERGVEHGDQRLGPRPLGHQITTMTVPREANS
jgi:hypothetical protein